MESYVTCIPHRFCKISINSVTDVYENWDDWIDEVFPNGSNVSEMNH